MRNVDKVSPLRGYIRFDMFSQASLAPLGLRFSLGCYVEALRANVYRNLNKFSTLLFRKFAKQVEANIDISPEGFYVIAQTEAPPRRGKRSLGKKVREKKPRRGDTLSF